MIKLMNLLEKTNIHLGKSEYKVETMRNGRIKLQNIKYLTDTFIFKNEKELNAFLDDYTEPKGGKQSSHFEGIQQIREGNSALWVNPKTQKEYSIQFISHPRRWEMDIQKKGDLSFSKSLTIKRLTLKEIENWLKDHNLNTKWLKKLKEPK